MFAAPGRNLQNLRPYLIKTSRLVAILIGENHEFFIADSIILVLRLITANSGALTGLPAGFVAAKVVQSMRVELKSHS
jgi:hypothetical protein